MLVLLDQLPMSQCPVVRSLRYYWTRAGHTRVLDATGPITLTSYRWWIGSDYGVNQATSSLISTAERATSWAPSLWVSVGVPFLKFSFIMRYSEMGGAQLRSGLHTCTVLHRFSDTT